MTFARDETGTKRSLVIDRERDDISFSFSEKQGRDRNRKAERERERERERRRRQSAAAICNSSDEIWEISCLLISASVARRSRAATIRNGEYAATILRRQTPIGQPRSVLEA